VKQRSPIAVFFLYLFTIGIYSWYWLVKTKGEMNLVNYENARDAGASDEEIRQDRVPTAWIWLIPLAGYIWWIWKYSCAVEKVTNGRYSNGLAFLLLFLLHGLGQAIIQDAYNKV
jgi:hypothetical protein